MPDPSVGPATPDHPETNVSDGPPQGATALLGAQPDSTSILPDSGALIGAPGSSGLLPVAVQHELPSDSSNLPATTVRDPAVVPGPQLIPPETHNTTLARLATNRTNLATVCSSVSQSVTKTKCIMRESIEFIKFCPSNRTVFAQRELPASPFLANKDLFLAGSR